jgi:hypothetical protein
MGKGGVVRLSEGGVGFYEEIDLVGGSSGFGRKRG